MSLWKVRHTLSPITEAALVALALSYGIFIIYLAQVRPLVVAVAADVRSVPSPVSLDTDEWSRATNIESRYVFGVPEGWFVEASHAQRVALGRSRAALEGGGGDIIIESRPVDERTDIGNIASADLAGSRPALYDVAVHGREGLFAVEFDRGRVSAQTVYVRVGGRIHIIRADALDPAVFSTFISTVKFLPETGL